MSTTKRRKSAKETRVLVASIITAAAIVAGSTFAWFSSSDEVTNRLSANADYGVTIAEDFTPPENWLPGQTVEKNVGVVNTGNVDAFVRTWLEGEMDLIAQTKSEIAANGFNGEGLTVVTDAQLRSVGLTFKNADGKYFKELDQIKRYANPDLVNPLTVHSDAYTEVEAVQAGGVLVSAPDKAEFTFQPNQAINIHNEKGEDIHITQNAVVNVTIDPEAETDVVAEGSEGIFTVVARSVADFGKIDTDRFTPKTTGEYIFLRNVALATPGSSEGGLEAVDDFELTGYVYVDGISSALATDSTGSGDATTTYIIPGNVEQGTSDIEVDPVYGGYFKVNYSSGEVAYISADEYAVLSPDDQGGWTTNVPEGGDPILFKNGDTYYVGATKVNPTVDPTEGGTYFALEYDDGHTQRSDYVLANGKGGTQEDPANAAVYTYTKETDGSYTFADTGIKVFTAEEKNIANKDLKWFFTEPSGTGETAVPAQFHVFYDSDTTDNSTFAEPDQRDIVIDIDLANLGTEAEQWTKMSAEGKTDTFYYNNDLEAGATTAKLVDAVTLNEKVTQYAFLAFDFDLNVFMDSVQVYVDVNGNEGFDSVAATFAEADAESTIVSANASATVGNPEIETITWEAAGAAPVNPDPIPPVEP